MTTLSILVTLLIGLKLLKFSVKTFVKTVFTIAVVYVAYGIFSGTLII